MKTTKLLICAVAVAAALAAVNAQAQNLPATMVEISPGLPVTGTFDNGNFIQEMPSGVSRLSSDFGDFEAFCVEPLQSLSYGQSLIFEIQSPSTLENSDLIARLIGGYLQEGQTNENAAAVQWAIWEIVAETNLSTSSLSTGNVRIVSPDSEATALLADQFLTNVNTYSPVTLTYLTNTEFQDVVTWQVIPEPASAGLAALSGLLLLRRRRA